MENYEALGTIGEGTYGVVLKARHKETGRVVAIKKFKESEEDEQVRKTALREVRILKQLKHENIVNLLEVFRRPRDKKLFLVFEFVEKTILEELENHPYGLEELEVKKYTFQLLRAVEYCHANNIIHRDVKPENILISRNGVLKLCDFGFARPMGGPGTKYTDYVATRWYRSPELLVGDTEYGKNVDVWAIGCMVAEIATGIPLFPGESDIDQLFHIIRCFGRLTQRQIQIFKRNPLYTGIELPEPKEPETLDKRLAGSITNKHLLLMLKVCLIPEPEQRDICTVLLGHAYFMHNGFCSWFEDEFRSMKDRDEAYLRMQARNHKRPRSRERRRSNSGSGPSQPAPQQRQEEPAGAPASVALPTTQIAHSSPLGQTDSMLAQPALPRAEKGPGVEQRSGGGLLFGAGQGDSKGRPPAAPSVMSSQSGSSAPISSAPQGQPMPEPHARDAGIVGLAGSGMRENPSPLGASPWAGGHFGTKHEPPLKKKGSMGSKGSLQQLGQLRSSDSSFGLPKTRHGPLKEQDTAPERLCGPGDATWGDLFLQQHQQRGDTRGGQRERVQQQERGDQHTPPDLQSELLPPEPPAQAYAKPSHGAQHGRQRGAQQGLTGSMAPVGVESGRGAAAGPPGGPHGAVSGGSSSTGDRQPYLSQALANLPDLGGGANRSTESPRHGATPRLPAPLVSFPSGSTGGGFGGVYGHGAHGGGHGGAHASSGGPGYGGSYAGGSYGSGGGLTGGSYGAGSYSGAGSYAGMYAGGAGSSGVGGAQPGSGQQHRRDSDPSQYQGSGGSPVVHQQQQQQTHPGQQQSQQPQQTQPGGWQSHWQPGGQQRNSTVLPNLGSDRLGTGFDTPTIVLKSKKKTKGKDKGDKSNGARMTMQFNTPGQYGGSSSSTAGLGRQGGVTTTSGTPPFHALNYTNALGVTNFAYVSRAAQSGPGGGGGGPGGAHGIGHSHGAHGGHTSGSSSSNYQGS